MGSQAAHVFVIVLTLAAGLFGQVSTTQPPLDEITDSDAYAVYSEVLGRMSASSKGTVLLQQETEPRGCPPPFHEPDADWQAAVDNFSRENSRVRSLVPLLQMEKPYLLVPSAQIKTDYAWVAAQYLSSQQTMQFVSVSAVGFDRSKTRAVVYVNQTGRGALVLREKRDGVWGTPSATNLVACMWIE